MKRLPPRRALAVLALFALAVAWWALRDSRAKDRDGREHLVFFAGWMVGDEVYGAIHRFEQLHPEYTVTTVTIFWTTVRRSSLRTL